MHIILASASPRRAELLKQVGAHFTVEVSEVNEDLQKQLMPLQLAQSLALEKATAVAKNYHTGIIIGADTIVVLGQAVLGKPNTQQEAKFMLQRLSNQWHEVITAIALIDSSGAQPSWQEQVVTKVKFRQLTSQDIDAYVATGEWTDKAGSYGIQGFGALLVEKIEGCYFNVVGLPLQRLAQGLQVMGVNLYDYRGSQV